MANFEADKQNEVDIYGLSYKEMHEFLKEILRNIERLPKEFII